MLCEICFNTSYGKLCDFCSKTIRGFSHMRMCKPCGKCKVVFPLTNKFFPPNKKVQYHHYCRNCLSTIQSGRFIRRKMSLCNWLGSKCCVCGFDECIEALDFHHVDPTAKSKFLTIGSLWNHSWNIILEEVAKCVILCSNCHRKYHAGLIDWNLILSEHQIVLELLKKFKPPNVAKPTRPNVPIKEIFQLDWNANSTSALVKKYNVSPTTIKRWAQKYNLASKKQITRKPPKEVLAELLDEKPQWQIAKEFGVSDKAVEKWRKSYNIPPKGRGYWTKIKFAKASL